MTYHIQFNDGLGWRGSTTSDDLQTAVSDAKERFNRWPNDHLRVVHDDNGDYKIMWWQDGINAEERWG